MSDLGLLSHQYQELAALARQLRQWVMQVKQAYYHLPPDNTEGVVEPDDLITAMKELAHIAEFLKEVVGLENEGMWPDRWLADPPLPPMLVKRLRELHAFERPLYINQLAQLTSRLRNDIDALTEKDLELIDDVTLAMNADVNAVFRRLMRWA